MSDEPIRRVAILSDRIGYEERGMLRAARAAGLEAQWIDDGALCAGPIGLGMPAADLHLVRSRSYTRGAALAALLEDGGARTINCSTAIEVCQSKLATSRLLAREGVPTVDFRLVLSRADVEAALAAFGLPLVLKPILGGLGRRVLLVRDADLLHATYDYVEHFAQSYDRVLMAQPFQPGADVRAIVAGDEVLTAIVRRAGEDWRANVATGAVATSLQSCVELQEIAARVAATTGAAIFGLDLFRSGAGYVVGEVNHVPMFRAAAAVTGVDVAARIVDRLLAGALVPPAPRPPLAVANGAT